MLMLLSLFSMYLLNTMIQRCFGFKYKKDSEESFLLFITNQLII